MLRLKGKPSWLGWGTGDSLPLLYSDTFLFTRVFPLLPAVIIPRSCVLCELRAGRVAYSLVFSPRPNPESDGALSR